MLPAIKHAFMEAGVTSCIDGMVSARPVHTLLVTPLSIEWPYNR